ncbi:MAG: acyl-CoA dehydrogenase, partial [Candidatus Methylomirabilis sp.]|nr:acyl-CoA dehydrogenase [Deltaproteobacteria bacterium]
DRSKGAKGITAFIVEKGFPGFKVNRELDKTGLRTSPTGELFYESCEVPDENVLGAVGGAAAILHGSLEWERSLLLTRAVGDMQRKLEKCVEYANTRVQFGRPIGKNQAISHRLAEMKVRIEAARLFCYQVAWLKSQGKPAMMEAAIAKLFTSEARTQCALDAIQIHGGYGYMKEFEVERDLRDSLAGTIGAGSSEIQRNIIARLLGL